MATEGNVTHAAERLRTSHRTLRRLLASEPQLDNFAAELRLRNPHSQDSVIARRAAALLVQTPAKPAQ